MLTLNDITRESIEENRENAIRNYDGSGRGVKNTTDKFWSLTSWDEDCLLFNGGLTEKGYGVFKLGKKHWRAHRLAWTLFFGEIPNGLCVCHRCDVRRCVNPQHLFLGTLAENIHDMIEKGRDNFAKFGPRHDLRGNLNVHSKLSPGNVRYIRSSKKTNKELARLFGVSDTIVGKCRKGMSYKNVI